MVHDDRAEPRVGAPGQREPAAVTAAGQRRAGQRACSAPGDPGDHGEPENHPAAGAAPHRPGGRICARSAIAQAASNADRPVLTRTVGTTNARPPKVTDDDGRAGQRQPRSDRQTRRPVRPACPLQPARTSRQQQ